MKPGFCRKYLNPIDLMKSHWPDACLAHITYDPELLGKDADYSVNRQGGGDGTLMFTIEVMQKTLLPIVIMKTFCTQDDPVDWDKVKRITYTIGRLMHFTAWGRIELNCGMFPGQRDRFRLPVIAKIEYN